MLFSRQHFPCVCEVDNLYRHLCFFWYKVPRPSSISIGHWRIQQRMVRFVSLGAVPHPAPHWIGKGRTGFGKENMLVLLFVWKLWGQPGSVLYNSPVREAQNAVTGETETSSILVNSGESEQRVADHRGVGGSCPQLLPMPMESSWQEGQPGETHHLLR